MARMIRRRLKERSFAALAAWMVLNLSGVLPMIEQAHAAGGKTSSSSHVGTSRVLSIDDLKNQVSPAVMKVIEVRLKAAKVLAGPAADLKKTFTEFAKNPKTVDFSRFQNFAQNIFHGLEILRDELARLAVVIAADLRDIEAANVYYQTVVGYFWLVGSLTATIELARNRGRDIGLTDEQLQALAILVPYSVGNKIIATPQANEAKASGQEEAFDIPFTVKAAPNGMYRIWMSARQAGRYRLRAFEAEPSSDFLKRPLTFGALKIVLARRAMLKTTYLYDDEVATLDPKKKFEMPANADVIVRQLEADADALARESAFRKYISSGLLDPIAKAMLPDSRAFTEQARVLVTVLAVSNFHLLNADLMVKTLGLPRSIADILKRIQPPRDFATNPKAQQDYVVQSKTPQFQKSARVFSDYVKNNPDLFDPAVKKLVEVVYKDTGEELRKALIGQAVYLTEMPRGEFRDFVIDTARTDLSVSIVFGIFGKMLMGFGSAGQQVPQQALNTLMMVSQKFAEEQVSGTRLTDPLIDRFLESRFELERQKAFQRYGLATKVIVAAEILEALAEEVKWLEPHIKEIPMLLPKPLWIIQALLDLKKTPAEMKKKRIWETPAGQTFTVPEDRPFLRVINPRIAARVVFSDPEMPIWIDEMLQHMGAQVLETSSPSELAALQDVAVRWPSEVRQTVSRLSSYATSSVIARTRRLHEGLMNTNAYSWRPITGKILVLLKSAEEAKDESMTEFLEALISLDNLAKSVSASSLRTRVSAVFNQTIAGEVTLDHVLNRTWGKRDELDELLREGTLAEELAGRKFHEISKFFAPFRERNAFFRGRLTDPEIYLAYLSQYTEQHHLEHPYLSIDIKMHSQVADKSYDKPVKLADFVLGLKRAIENTAADISLVEQPLRALGLYDLDKNGKFSIEGVKAVQDASRLSRAADVKKSSSPEQLSLYAVRQLEEQSSYTEIIVGFFDRARIAGRAIREEAREKCLANSPKDRKSCDELTESWSAKVSSYVAALPSAFTSKDNRGPVSFDYYWPEKFLVRDVLPAAFDRDAKGDTTGDNVRALRVAVSALISPYLRATAAVTDRDLMTLLDPSTDHTKAMMQTEAYRVFAGEVSENIGTAMNQIEGTGLRFRDLVNGLKKVTTLTQKYNNLLFYGTLFGEVGGAEHLLANYAMLFSAVADWAADGGLLFDYWRTYSELHEFALGGGFGLPLVSYDEINRIRKQAYEQAKVLWDRSFMDAMFLGSMVSGYRQHAIALKGFLRQLRSADRTARRIRERDPGGEFDAKMNKINELCGELKVPPVLDLDLFNQLYASRTAELRAKASDGRGTESAIAAIHLDQWKALREYVRYMNYDPKLREVMRLMMEQQSRDGAAGNENGPDSPDTKAAK